MVVPLFGWSAGDVVLSIKLLYRVSKAFRDAEGAQKQYAEVAAWLGSFAGVLDRIRDFITDSPRPACVPGILKILENIDLAYAKFENYLTKYQSLRIRPITSVTPERTRERLCGLSGRLTAMSIPSKPPSPDRSLR
jgi:hypothetical protein